MWDKERGFGSDFKGVKTETRTGLEPPFFSSVHTLQPKNFLHKSCFFSFVVTELILIIIIIVALLLPFVC